MPENVIIDLSTDGARVDKGVDQFWPHQYRIFNIADKRPIIAGIFQGKEKPSNAFKFHQELVQEIMDIREEGGIVIRNQQLALTVRCFIGDAPARAFVLNHYGHSSSNVCSKCKVEGHRCTISDFGGTMVFQGIRHELRTDESYQNLVDDDYHKGRSPLAPLLGLVTQVPFEVMHAVHLGNCKKILSAQVGGKFAFRRLNARKLAIIDSRMLTLTSYCPSEFNRHPREITMYHRFKATEFGQLLLYTAPAVLKNVILEDYYRHLMILHSVMRLLISEETPRDMYPFCQEALETYVTLSEQLYGQQFLSYNVHCLLHLVDDAELLGPLETVSAFSFENNMPELRKCLRKPALKLPQVYKRISEKADFTITLLDNGIRIHLIQRHAAGPVLDNICAKRCRQFRKIKVGKFTFGTALRDSCCWLKYSEICCIKNIILIGGRVYLIIQEFRSSTEIYDVGIASDSVQVYYCRNLSHGLQAVQFTAVKSKVYMMPKWSDVEGGEEVAVQNEWICVSLLSGVARKC